MMRGFSVLIVLAAAGCASSTDDPATGPNSDEGRLLHTPKGPVACTCDHPEYVCPRAARGLEISPVPLDLGGKSAAEIVRIGYGSYVVNAMSDCASCHSSGAGFLAGGNPFPVDRAGHVVFSRNLTPDPTGLQLTESQFVEAIRTGRDFHPGAAGMLVVMPWPNVRWASDGDLDAIYAYLHAIPAAHNVVPPDNKAGLGLPPAIPFSGVYDEGDVARPLPADDGSINANLQRGLAIQPLAEPSDLGDANEFARGSYMANSLSTCGECHTQGTPGAGLGRDPMLHLVTSHYMTGGNVFKVPPPLQPVLHQNRTMSANLTGATHGFFHEPGVDDGLFLALIHTQSHVDDTPPRPLGFPMPAAQFSNQLDADLESLFTYASHVTPNTTADLPRQDYARWCASAADCDRGETCHVDPDPEIGNECVGKSCTTDADCDACQTCGSCGTCEAPTATSTCILNSF